MAVKLYRRGSWRLVDLSQASIVLANLEQLDSLRLRNTAVEEEPEAWYNIWGLFERMDRNNFRV